MWYFIVLILDLCSLSYFYMLPWCLNLIFFLMSPSKPSVILILHMVCLMSFKIFQYGRHYGHFAYKNASICNFSKYIARLVVEGAI